MAHPRTILVSGDTGYVGGRLVPRLLEAGYRVRCLVRAAAYLQGRAWLPQVELLSGDVLKQESLRAARRGAAAVPHLVHSMPGGSDFSGRDLQAAGLLACTARTAGGQRIIYPGA